MQVFLHLSTPGPTVRVWPVSPRSACGSNLETRECGCGSADEEITDAIRTPECSIMASEVSALSEVRRALVPQQRRMGAAHGGVMEGRDIGSVVFPDAALKVFLTASPEVRGHRRFQELRGRGVDVSLEEVVRDQAERDHRDTSRPDSPLQVARGAVVVDTSGMTLDGVVERLVELVGRVKPDPISP